MKALTATRVTHRGREYDLTRSLDVNDLAFQLGVHREIAALRSDNASQDEVTAAIWRTLLVGAYAAAGVR